MKYIGTILILLAAIAVVGAVGAGAFHLFCMWGMHEVLSAFAALATTGFVTCLIFGDIENG